MDQLLFRAIHGLRTPWLDKPMGFLSEWGYWWPPVLFLCALLYKRDKKTGAIARDGMLAWFAAVPVAEQWIKPLVKRTRPPHTPSLQGFVHVLGDVPRRTSFSFPSGTSAIVFAAATVIWLHLGRRAGIAAMLAAALVSVSRVYVGVHFPGDIAGGALVGTAVGYGVVRFSKWVG